MVFWACTCCGVAYSVLALLMMAVSSWGGIGADWMLISFFFLAVARVWIISSLLLVTSIFPVATRSKNTAFVMATGTAIAGFFPLALSENSNTFASGTILSIAARAGCCRNCLDPQPSEDEQIQNLSAS